MSPWWTRFSPFWRPASCSTPSGESSPAQWATGTRSSPPFDAYRAKDGVCVVACGTDKFFSTLCGVMGKPELADDPRFSSNSLRCANYSELKAIIEDWTTRLSLEELERLILAAGIPFGKVQNTAQACASDFIQRRNMLWTVEDPAV